MSGNRRDCLVLLLFLVGAALLAGLAPLERVLGSSARIVYLHGAWVWAALLAFSAAALAGLAGFLLRKESLHRWSVGLGRSGTVFWLTSLLLSLAAMQTSWNGLYLAEPRWRLGVRFGLVAVLLQLAVTVFRRPRLGSALNIVFVGILVAALLGAESVLHPPSPVFTSDSVAIRVSFLVLLGAALAASWLLARILRPNA
jgi:hypothetical protein